MVKAYNILIIDDHQIIIDTYNAALERVSNDNSNINFNISQAKDCDSAYDEIIADNTKNNIDLIFLDIQLPPSVNHKFNSGEDLGIFIKSILPKTKIIVCTSVNDSSRLNNIFKMINPEGFLVKSDIIFNDLINSIKSILLDKNFYSQTILGLMSKSND